MAGQKVREDDLYTILFFFFKYLVGFYWTFNTLLIKNRVWLYWWSTLPGLEPASSWNCWEAAVTPGLFSSEDSVAVLQPYHNGVGLSAAPEIHRLVGVEVCPPQAIQVHLKPSKICLFICSILKRDSNTKNVYALRQSEHLKLGLKDDPHIWGIRPCAYFTNFFRVRVPFKLSISRDFLLYVFTLDTRVADPDPVGSGHLGPDPDSRILKLTYFYPFLCWKVIWILKNTCLLTLIS
jgi:hypothetical protein